MWDLGEFMEYDPLLKAAVVVCTVLFLGLIAAVIAAHAVMKKRGSHAVTTREITYGAVCLAASFALSYIGVRLPQGGRITPASSLPIMIYCYYFGFRRAVVVCFAYMLLQFLQSPYIYTPMSAVLDYVIPYLALIFTGVFAYKAPAKDGATADATDSDSAAAYNLSSVKDGVKKHARFFIGAACYIVVRYLSHVLSGAIFYSSYDLGWRVWASWAYSFGYNSFFLIDVAISVTAAVFVLASKTFDRFMAVSANTLQNADTAQKDY
ncbi:MAG: energy-coupled thiamine transporter ThiT [Clostridiales bacterium]|jgi:thiamine transporter|nr:energy-coupled thiamine transporter ThiT [Clostridiales bacterium]